MPVKINTDKCIGCGICIKACPEPNVIKRGDGGGTDGDKKKVSINTLFCKMCLLCASVCPKNAIHSED